jgi:tetratricopeptide (TPR) repeat protein
MRLLIAASLLVMAALSWGEPEEAPAREVQNATTPDKPSPQLISLERLLVQKQEARDSSALPPEQYRQFVAKFRVDLESLMTRLPPTPANQGLHALILSRLGGQDRETAGANLAQALEANPGNPELLRAQGQILYEQRDFPAAAEAARQAWEASGHKDKAAWALLKMSEGRVSGSPSSAGATAKAPAPPQAAVSEWTIPQNHDISPQAMGHIQKAIASRGQGDLATSWASAQAAMNADPTSKAVQKFYEAVRAERVQTQETRAFIQSAVQALGAGRGEEAIAWAQKATERSPGEDTKAVLDDVRRRSGALSPPPPVKAPAPKGGSPLLPLLAAGGAGLTALGLYKVAVSRSARSSDNGLDPSPEVSPEQERRNYNSITYVAIPAVVFALVYGGPPAWRAAAPTVTTLLRGRRAISRRAGCEPKIIGFAEVALEFMGTIPQGSCQWKRICENRRAPLYAACCAAHDATQPHGRNPC